MRALASFAAWCLASALAAAAAQGPPAADDLARRLQARYDTIRSFAADFAQSYEGGLLNLPTTERGTLQLQKPGRFRMEYLQPEKKVFVSDGETLFSYFPADSVGSRDPIPAGEQASTALQFVAGKGDLVRDFAARMADTQPEGEWRLELTPRSPTPDFETLLLMVDRESLALRAFGWTDDQGGTTITRLSNLRENARIPGEAFTFRFPPGTIIR